MLDLEVIVPPVEDGLSIVSLAEFKRHMLISHTKLDDDFEEIIIEAADKLHGRDGELNRTLFPTTYRRYLSKWPSGPIPLPFPPIINVLSVDIVRGEELVPVATSSYVVREGALVPEIELRSGQQWPTVAAGPRAIAITYQAGYLEYPPKLRRLVKIMAGHYSENREATVLDSRVSNVSRAVEFGVSDLRNSLRIPVDYSDWGE